MGKENILEIFKNTIKNAVPAQDKRTVIPHLHFISGLIFCFIGDTKNSSLETIRRFMMNSFDMKISRGAFWERLSRNRLKNILHDVLTDLIQKIPSTALVGSDILKKLDVCSILLIDSSSITLWDGAKKSHPGTRTHAGIKWHACFNLLSGKMEWFSTTSTSVHDRKCFPDIDWLKGKLIIFDLGYWDYSLFDSIALAKGYFLSRVKSNAVITIHEVLKGIGKHLVGKKLLEIHFKKKRGSIIEFIGEIGCGTKPSHYRVIGFWNSHEKKYHWYVTNLKVSAIVIYSLYKIRWQIELIFKGCKSSLNLDEKLTSNNANIIESLVLSSIIASFSMHLIFNLGIKGLTEKEKLAISFQRLAHVTVLLAKDFINFLTLSGCRKKLEKKIEFFSTEIFEKNYRRRPTSLQELFQNLECL